MKITPVAEMQQGIIISFYAIFFTFSARNPTLSKEEKALKDYTDVFVTYSITE